MSKPPINIVWFRQDLRINDNPALYHASQEGLPILPIYILDDKNAGEYKIGSACRWWLYYALESLNQSFDNCLSLYNGAAEDIIGQITAQFNVNAIYWNRCYEPWRINRDKQIKLELESQGVNVHSYNGSLLWEPWHALKDNGEPYKVFTPFYRKGCLKSQHPPREPLKTPEKFSLTNDQDSLSLESLSLLPKIRWDKQLESHWDIREQGALNQLEEFTKNGLSGYKEGRNFPSKHNVSRLSPYLHHGMISPHQIWHYVQQMAIAGDINSADLEHFQSELGWREFSYSLLYHFPYITWKNLQEKFDRFPWIRIDSDTEQSQRKLLNAWQKGQTGYPIVDAAMRELWQTGYMHNRMRMVVGSFLVKNLLIDWRHGERWFWDCLVDADLANNSASWQWIAGCGADAAPYFRIFNPITQGQKFDPDGEYTKKFVPELSTMPNKYLFDPWQAPENILKITGIELGVDYPFPIVNIKSSRELALKAFESLKEII